MRICDGDGTNGVTLITEQDICELELMSKEDVAVRLTDELLKIYKKKS